MTEEIKEAIVPPKVVSIGTRKEFTAPSPTEKPAEFTPNANLLLFVNSLVERVTSGDITALGVAGVSLGYPMSVIAAPATMMIPEMAVLSMACDSLKDQVMDRAFSHVRYIGLDGEELADDDDYFDEDDAS